MIRARLFFIAVSEYAIGLRVKTLNPDSSSIDDVMAQTDRLHGVVRDLKENRMSIDDVIAQIKKLESIAYGFKEALMPIAESNTLKPLEHLDIAREDESEAEAAREKDRTEELEVAKLKLMPAEELRRKLVAAIEKGDKNVSQVSLLLKVSDPNFFWIPSVDSRGFPRVVEHLHKVGAKSLDQEDFQDSWWNIFSRAPVQRPSAKTNQFTGVDGITPLIYAARHGHLEIVRLLVAAGADVFRGDSVDPWCTPLWYATAAGHRKIDDFLLEEELRRKLVAAIEKGDENEVWKQLELFKASRTGVDYANTIGNTPLHYAAMKGHLPIVRALEYAGANKNALNADGKTPAQVASKYGHHEVANLLSQ